MWLSEQTARKPETVSGGDVGVVTIGGPRSAVASGGEVRGLPVAGPGGMVWMPREDSEVVTLDCGGTSVILGVVGNTVPAGMEPGDVYLYAGQAAVLLKRNGDITLTGNVTVRGSLAVENGGNDNGTEAG